MEEPYKFTIVEVASPISRTVYFLINRFLLAEPKDNYQKTFPMSNEAMV